MSELMMFAPNMSIGARDVLVGLRDLQTLSVAGHDDFLDAHHSDLSQQQPQMEPVLLPYGTIEVIFNHHNVWANVSEADPGKIRYDLDDETQWLPFITEESRIPAPIPFYDVKPLGPRLANSRCRALRNLVWNEIKAGFMVWRHRANMETKVFNDFSGVLEEGLEIMERLRVTPPTVVRAIKKRTQETTDLLVEAELEKDRVLLGTELRALKRENEKYDLDYWRGKLMTSIPNGYLFEGVPLNFAYCDHKRIRRWIMEKYEYHEDSDESVGFALGVFVGSYPNSVNNVWVFVGKLWPAVAK